MRPSKVSLGKTIFIPILSMFSTKDMTKVLIFVLYMMVALNRCDAERNRNRSRKNQPNRQFKRQRNSETSESTSACMDLTKKVLRMRYETGINGTNLSGLAMLPPTQVLPTYQGVASGLPMGAARVSTCPSRLHTNFDRDRWPRVIMEASCSCDHCYLGLRAQRMIVGGDDDDETCPKEEQPAGYCRPIMRQIAVLRRSGCVGDFHHYDWDSVNVAVGCECVIGRKPAS